MRVLRLCLSLLVVALLLCAGLASAQTTPATDTSFETPRKAMEVFLQAAQRDDFVRAADALDLHLIPASQRKVKGPDVAEQLYVALSRAVWIDIDAIPDEAHPKADDRNFRVTTVPLGGRDVPITLTSSATTATQKEPRWMVSSATVALAPQLYEQYGPGPIERRLSPSLVEPRLGPLRIWQWVGLCVALLVGYVVGRAVGAGVMFFAKRVAARTKAKWDDELVLRLRRPVRLWVGLIAFRMLVEPLSLSAGVLHATETILKVAFILVLGMALLRLVVVIAHGIEARAIEASSSVTGAMHARGVTTQVRMLQRVINIGVGILTVALALVQFETVRNVGVSLLASAGLAGVVFGLAAQRTLGSLIAGIQVSATQIVRIGDEVVVEKEFGTIEEITLTYIVVKIWDERRLVVPMSRFLDQPFESWTRTSTTLHGTIFLHADPALPVSLVRMQLEKLLKDDKRWDGRTKNVQVTDSTDRVMMVRILVSAANSSQLSDLRSYLREQLYAWLATLEGGKYLSRQRVEEGPLPQLAGLTTNGAPQAPEARPT